jgi:predicted ATPase
MSTPAAAFGYGSIHCTCREPHRTPRLIAVTGGPGAGKTAVLEMARRMLCEHVAILPEAASIVFGGGFPRQSNATARRAAQRTIYWTERELERFAMDEGRASVILCDRGTIDGLAYWPGDPADFWSDIGSSASAELARYETVIHLHTPDGDHGYGNTGLRIESPSEALAIDARIAEVWTAHPHRVAIDSRPSFLEKVHAALEALRSALPACCRAHPTLETIGL